MDENLETLLYCEVNLRFEGGHSVKMVAQKDKNLISNGKNLPYQPWACYSYTFTSREKNQINLYVGWLLLLLFSC
jgi:hypothetical protein